MPHFYKRYNDRDYTNYHQMKLSFDDMEKASVANRETLYKRKTVYLRVLDQI